MNNTDPFAIAAEGVTLDALVPSQGLGEAQINALVVPPYAREVASVFRISNPKPIVLPKGDIDAAASVIQQTGKGVMVWFFFTQDEWATDIPELDPANASMTQYSPQAINHSVTAVDFTLLNGKKALVIEDSARFGGITRRIVTEDFHKARNIFAGYPMNFRTATTALPRHTFTKPLIFIGMDAQGRPLNSRLDQKADVIALQTALQALGFFPSNIAPTGLYGALTAKAVYDWQVARSVASKAELDILQGRAFGPASIEAMNREMSI